MAIYLTAEFEIRPEAKERVEQAIRTFVDQIRIREPGTLLYSSHVNSENPNRYLHFFVFGDAAAEELHRNTDWVRAFTDVLYPETVNGVTFTRYHMVASTSPRF